MIEKVYDLLGIKENTKAQNTLSRMINYRIQNLETLFLSNLESLCEQLQVNVLDKQNQIDFREKVSLICDAHIEGDQRKMSLYEMYYQKPSNVSTVKSISKDNYKFAEAEKDVSKIDTVKKSDYRFASDKDNLNGGLK